MRSRHSSRRPLSGTDTGEIVFFDLSSRILLLRLDVAGNNNRNNNNNNVIDVVVVDLIVVVNDAQSQSALLITHRSRRRGSGDAGVGGARRQWPQQPTRLQQQQQSPQQQQHYRDEEVQQSWVILEKRMESNLAFPPLDLDFAEEYVFQVRLQGDGLTDGRRDELTDGLSNVDLPSGRRTFDLGDRRTKRGPFGSFSMSFFFNVFLFFFCRVFFQFWTRWMLVYRFPGPLLCQKSPKAPGNTRNRNSQRYAG